MTTPSKTAGHGAGAVTGLPLCLLRLEGLILLAASLTAFFVGLDQAWWLVPALLLLPDVAIASYARSGKARAIAYDLAHSYPAPAVLGAWALLSDAPVGQGVALIWFAHIGMDRALGYGLKYDTHFTHTHLGRIGAQVRDVQAEEAAAPGHHHHSSTVAQRRSRAPASAPSGGLS